MKFEDLEKEYSEETGTTNRDSFGHYKENYVQWISNKVPEPKPKPIVKNDFLVIVNPVNGVIRNMGYAYHQYKDKDWVTQAGNVLTDKDNVAKNMLHNFATYRINLNQNKPPLDFRECKQYGELIDYGQI